MLNQVSFKDLFSANPGQLLRKPHDSDNNGSQNSQFPYSQMDFPDSQLTQDVNGSQHNSSQLSQTSDSPGKKFYQRYMSKSAVFNRDSAANKSLSAVNKASYQQQYQLNKARAQDRDERDLLNSMLGSVRECASEMRTAVEVVRENVQHGTAQTQENLAKYLDKIESGLEKHSAEFTKAMSLRDDSHEQITKLQQEISAKNASIDKLQIQLDELRKKQKDDILKQLKEMQKVSSKNPDTSETISDFIEEQRKEIRRESKQLEKKQNDLDRASLKSQQKLVDQHKTLMKDVQARMQQSIEWQEDKHREHSTDMKCEVQALLSQTTTKFTEDVAALLKVQMKHMENISQKQNSDILTRQSQDFSKLLEKYQHKQEDLIKKLGGSCCCRETKPSGQQSGNGCHEQDQQKNKQLDELEKLKTRHEAEVKRLLAEQAAKEAATKVTSSLESRRESAQYWTQPAQHNPRYANTASDVLQDDYVVNLTNSDSGITSQCESQVGVRQPGFSVADASFVSPILPAANTWSSRYLFSKKNTDPSPVTAVLPHLSSKPQCKITTQTDLDVLSEEETVGMSALDCANNEENAGKVKTKKRKRSIFANPKRRRRRSSSNSDVVRVTNNNMGIKSSSKQNVDVQKPATDRSKKHSYIDQQQDMFDSISGNSRYSLPNQQRQRSPTSNVVAERSSRALMQRTTSDERWQAALEMPRKPYTACQQIYTSYYHRSLPEVDETTDNEHSSQEVGDSDSTFSSPSISVRELMIKTRLRSTDQPAPNTGDHSMDYSSIFSSPDLTVQKFRRESHGQKSLSEQHNLAVATEVVVSRHGTRPPLGRITRSQSRLQ